MPDIDPVHRVAHPWKDFFVQMPLPSVSYSHLRPEIAINAMSNPIWPRELRRQVPRRIADIYGLVANNQAQMGTSPSRVVARPIITVIALITTIGRCLRTLLDVLQTKSKAQELSANSWMPARFLSRFAFLERIGFAT